MNRVLKTVISFYIKGSYRNISVNLSRIVCSNKTAKSETMQFSRYFVNFDSEMTINGKEYEYSRRKNCEIVNSEPATLD